MHSPAQPSPDSSLPRRDFFRIGSVDSASLISFRCLAARQRLPA